MTLNTLTRIRARVGLGVSRASWPGPSRRPIEETDQPKFKKPGWWAGRESNPQSFRGGFTDRWARHVPIADPRGAPSPQGEAPRYGTPASMAGFLALVPCSHPEP